jgi:hypothetical protein
MLSLFRVIAMALVIVTITACTAKARLVSRRADDRPNPASRSYDVPSISWYAHSDSTAGVRIFTLLRDSDHIPPHTIVVRKSLRTLTLCYAVVPGLNNAVPDAAKPTTLMFRVPGIARSDKRRVLVSRSCAKKV